MLYVQEFLQINIGGGRSLHHPSKQYPAMDDASSAAVSAGEDTKTCPRGHWRPAEDEKLRQLVEQYGAQNWNSIAERLQGRSGIYK